MTGCTRQEKWKRRAADDARQVYVDVAADNFKVGARAEWEIRSGNGIEARRTQARFNAVRAADAASLDARRRKLAGLLAAEQAEQQEQLISLDMTPAQRAAAGRGASPRAGAPTQ